jgi:hypothetical protein
MGNSTATLEANLIGPFREGLREHGFPPLMSAFGGGTDMADL